jgi:hypothetical protein
MKLNHQIIVTLGEKDHTCNEVMFLEDDQYEKYLKSQKKARFDLGWYYKINYKANGTESEVYGPFT